MGGAAKEDQMGHDEQDDQIEEQDAVDEDPPEQEDPDEEFPLPPPTVETTLGFEGSIEGL